MQYTSQKGKEYKTTNFRIFKPFIICISINPKGSTIWPSLSQSNSVETIVSRLRKPTTTQDITTQTFHFPFNFLTFLCSQTEHEHTQMHHTKTKNPKIPSTQIQSWKKTKIHAAIIATHFEKSKIKRTTTIKLKKKKTLIDTHTRKKKNQKLKVKITEDVRKLRVPATSGCGEKLRAEWAKW